MYRTPTNQPVISSIGADGQFHPSIIGDWKPWLLKAFYTDMKMNNHQHFLIALPSGVGYANSKDITVALVYIGSATYLDIKYLVPQWIVAEQFIPHLKRTLYNAIEEVSSRLPKMVGDSLKQEFETNFLLLTQSFCYELASLPSTTEGTTKEISDGTKIRVDIEVEPLQFNDWEIIGNKADGIRFLYVDLKAAVNEHSQDKSQVKVAKLEEGGK